MGGDAKIQSDVMDAPQENEGAQDEMEVEEAILQYSSMLPIPGGQKRSAFSSVGFEALPKRIKPQIQPLCPTFCHQQAVFPTDILKNVQPPDNSLTSDGGSIEEDIAKQRPFSCGIGVPILAPGKDLLDKSTEEDSSLCSTLATELENATEMSLAPFAHDFYFNNMCLNIHAITHPCLWS
jgi:hypothetical protein